ncbi:MAG: hypothetical protein RR052_01355 [Oscillospiraceae bacterium]
MADNNGKSIFSSVFNAVKGYFAPVETPIEEGDDQWYDELAESFVDADEWGKFTNDEPMASRTFTASFEIANGKVPDGDEMLKATEVYPFIAELATISDPLYTLCNGAVADSEYLEVNGETGTDYDKVIKFAVNRVTLRANVQKFETTATLNIAVIINEESNADSET